MRSLTPPIRRQVTGVLSRGAFGPRRGALREDVEDLTQTILGELFAGRGRRLRRWDPQRGPLTTYVRQVARSRAIDHLRKRSRRPWADRPMSCGELSGIAGADPAPSVEARLIVKQLLQRSLDEVRRDPDTTTWSLLEHLFVAQLDTPELVRETGLSAGALYQRRRRLRLRLSEALQAHGGLTGLRSRGEGCGSCPIE